MLKRKITERMLEWKRTKGKQGLLITGARQVGKTSSIEDFADSHYGQTIKGISNNLSMTASQSRPRRCFSFAANRR